MTIPESRADAPDVVIVRIRRHGRILVLPALAFVGIATAWGYFGRGFEQLWLSILFWLGSSLLVLVLWIWPYLTWLGNRVVITNRRVIIYHGIVVRSRQEIALSRIHDVTVRRHAIQVLFGSGDVLLNTGAHNPVRVHDLPQANLVLSALTELVDAQAPLSVAMRSGGTRWASN